MRLMRKRGDGTMSFVEFAKDHDEHAHCCGCGNCIVDPSDHVRFSWPIWCVGCRDKVEAKLPAGTQRPWLWSTRWSN